MKILFIGDVSAKPGRGVVKALLEERRKDFDIVIANCENAAHGIGATKAIIEELASYGVDFFTSGNDIWHQQPFTSYLDDPNGLVIRPLNYPAYFPGRGYHVLHHNGKHILIVNIIGQIFIRDEVTNPFRAIDDVLRKLDAGILEGVEDPIDTILVDFHAEATSEKVTMGFFLDGRVHAVIGTHTHVQTADERILPKGTAYITDVGMAGSLNSVLWVSYDSAIRKALNPFNFERFEVEESKPWVASCVVIEIGEDNTTKSIERLNYSVN